MTQNSIRPIRKDVEGEDYITKADKPGNDRQGFFVDWYSGIPKQPPEKPYEIRQVMYKTQKFKRSILSLHIQHRYLGL